jgi:uncharacterized protein YjiS (DUF1127 family)
MSVLGFSPASLKVRRPLWSIPAGRLSEVWQAAGREWQLRRAIGQINALDEAMLHDLGLDRGGIENAVRYGRRGGIRR